MSRTLYRFDVPSNYDMTAVGEIFVEVFEDEDGRFIEAGLAMRTDAYDMWGPPIMGTKGEG